jgi:hypothetical protein
MKKYKFCTHTSTESIGTCKAYDTTSAEKIFAKTKNLSLDEFLKIYRVLEA